MPYAHRHGAPILGAAIVAILATLLCWQASSANAPNVSNGLPVYWAGIGAVAPAAFVWALLVVAGHTGAVVLLTPAGKVVVSALPFCFVKENNSLRATLPTTAAAASGRFMWPSRHRDTSARDRWPFALWCRADSVGHRIAVASGQPLTNSATHPTECA